MAAQSTPYPVSDHCDGRRFFNPTGPGPRSLGEVWKWQRERMRGSAVPWPDQVPSGAKPSLPANVPAGQVAATWLGHSTYLLQTARTTVLTDPVFSSRAGPFGFLGPARVRPAALTLGSLPRIDVVVVSHNHYDHLDLASLRWLARQRRPQFVAPLGLKHWLEAKGITPVTELDWWQNHWVGEGAMEITCTPAQHWSSRLPWDRCLSLWGGYWLKLAEGGTVFFAGDSGWADHFDEIHRRLGSPDVSLLPIGAYEPRWFMASMHMNPDEAVRAHLALGSRASLGMHHATFRLTDEGFDAPVQDLAKARVAHGVADDTFCAPGLGETVVLPLR